MERAFLQFKASFAKRKSGTYYLLVRKERAGQNSLCKYKIWVREVKRH